MPRVFECKACESDDVAVSYKDYISYDLHDEACDPFLQCNCRRCGFSWTEKLSEELKKEEGNNE